VRTPGERVEQRKGQSVCPLRTSVHLIFEACLQIQALKDQISQKDQELNSAQHKAAALTIARNGVPEKPLFVHWLAKTHERACINLQIC
jgi:hypothetical protein